MITREDIENDIRDFQQRIIAANRKLAALPSGYLPYKEYKKKKAAETALTNEIKHVKQLLVYALEGLEDG